MYELAMRFERDYGGALSLSSVSHLYTAVGALRSRGLIEEIQSAGAGRQPKPHYQATENGMTSYREWLLGQIEDERKRQRLLAVQLAAFMSRPEETGEMLRRCEASCRAASDDGRGRDGVVGGDLGLVRRLVKENARLMGEARVSWVEYARAELGALVQERGGVS
jgi:DNA-binding PadR family transcriptional regulator